MTHSHNPKASDVHSLLETQPRIARQLRSELQQMMAERHGSKTLIEKDVFGPNVTRQRESPVRVPEMPAEVIARGTDTVPKLSR